MTEYVFHRLGLTEGMRVAGDCLASDGVGRVLGG